MRLGGWHWLGRHGRTWTRRPRAQPRTLVVVSPKKGDEPSPEAMEPREYEHESEPPTRPRVTTLEALGPGIPTIGPSGPGVEKGAKRRRGDAPRHGWLVSNPGERRPHRH